MRTLVLVVFCLVGCSSGHDTIPDSPGGGSGSGTPLANVAAISAGNNFACALLMDGSVKCWGQDDHGELGGTATSPLPCDSVTCGGPTTVAGATGTSIAAGLGGACVLGAGAVKCWGDNTNGQLGNGSTMSSSSPVEVTGILDATAISAGDQTMCALISGGGVECWGAGVLGQIGNNMISNALVPTAPAGLGTAAAIGAGDGRSCAVVGGAVYCWGDNNLGELGVDNTGNYSDMPVVAMGVSGATAVTSGGFTTCALIDPNGTVTCWGDDTNGEVGTGAVNSMPVSVPGASVGGLSSATSISSGVANFVCASTTGGSVYCWGSNSFGQLGNGGGSDSAIPVPVTGISTASVVAAGNEFACALLADHTVKCWGHNNDAQLGNGTTTDSATPTSVVVKQ